MPDCFGKLAVTTLVCFLFSHTRLRVRKTPGIPCALCFSRDEVALHDPGAKRAAGRWNIFCRRSGMVPTGRANARPMTGSGPDPEPRDSGLDALHRPGMTVLKLKGKMMRTWRSPDAAQRAATAAWC